MQIDALARYEMAVSINTPKLVFQLAICPFVWRLDHQRSTKKIDAAVLQVGPLKCVVFDANWTPTDGA